MRAKAAEAILKGKKITDALLKKADRPPPKRQNRFPISVPARNTGVSWLKSW